MSDNRRVFVSFDYDNDARLKDLLIGQASSNQSPFNFSDWSVKEHLLGDWKSKARKKMSLVSQVVVLCGEYTDKATGVAAELRIARELGKPYFLLKGYGDRQCRRPSSAAASDKIYLWTWKNLENLLNGAR